MSRRDRASLTRFTTRDGSRHIRAYFIHFTAASMNGLSASATIRGPWLSAGRPHGQVTSRRVLTLVGEYVLVSTRWYMRAGCLAGRAGAELIDQPPHERCGLALSRSCRTVARHGVPSSRIPEDSRGFQRVPEDSRGCGGRPTRSLAATRSWRLRGRGCGGLSARPGEKIFARKIVRVISDNEPINSSVTTWVANHGTVGKVRGS